MNNSGKLSLGYKRNQASGRLLVLDPKGICLDQPGRIICWNRLCGYGYAGRTV